MKKIILAILCVSTFLVAAETQSIEQQISELEVQRNTIDDKIKFLKSQLIAGGAEDVVDSKEKPAEVASVDEVFEKDNLGFKTHTELGFIKNSGNTNTETYSIDANVKKEWEKHILQLSLMIQYGEEDGVENKNKLFTKFDYYYKFTDRFAFDYLVGYKEDKFSGFDYQFYTGPGLVYKLIDGKKHTLFVKGNILYSQDAIEDTYLDGSGSQVKYPYPSGSINQDDAYTDEYAAYKAGIKYEWQMLENLKFVEDASYRSDLSDADNYFVYSKSALISKISDIFSFGMSYQVDYINESADGKTPTDETFMFNVIVDY